MKKIHLVNFPLASDDDSLFGDELLANLEDRGCTVTRTFVEDYALDLGDGRSIAPSLVSRESNQRLDVAGDIVFIKKRQAHNLYFTSLFAQFMALCGATQLQPRFEEHAKNVNKAAQAVNLVKHSFAIPRTILVPGRSYRDVQPYLETALGFPFVLKAEGSGGRNVWKINSFDEVATSLASVEEKRQETLVFQEFIKTSHEEFRVVMFDREVITCVRRSSEDFYNNVAQGGTADAFVLSEADRAMCESIFRIADLSYLAVDFMKLDDGTNVVTELQTGPSMSMSKSVNPNTVNQIADHLAKLASS